MDERHPAGCDPESFIRQEAPSDVRSRQPHRRHPSRVGITYPPPRRSSQGQRGSNSGHQGTSNRARERDGAIPRVRGFSRKLDNDARSKPGYFPLVEFQGLDAAIVEVCRKAWILKESRTPHSPRGMLDATVAHLTNVFIDHLNDERRRAARARREANLRRSRRLEPPSSFYSSPSGKRRRSLDNEYTSPGESDEEVVYRSSKRGLRPVRNPAARYPAPSKGARRYSEGDVRKARPRRAKEVRESLNEDDLCAVAELSSEIKPPERRKTSSLGQYLRPSLERSVRQDSRTEKTEGNEKDTEMKDGQAVTISDDDDTESSSEESDDEVILPVVLPKRPVRARCLFSDHMSLTPHIADDDESTDTEMYRKAQARKRRSTRRADKDVPDFEPAPRKMLLNRFGVPLSTHRLMNESLVVIPSKAEGARAFFLPLPQLGEMLPEEMRVETPVQSPIQPFTKGLAQNHVQGVISKPVHQDAKVNIQHLVEQVVKQTRPVVGGDVLNAVAGAIPLSSREGSAATSAGRQERVWTKGRQIESGPPLRLLPRGSATGLTAQLARQQTPQVLQHRVSQPRPQISTLKKAMQRVPSPKPAFAQDRQASEEKNSKISMENSQARVLTAPTPPVRVRSPDAPSSRLPQDFAGRDIASRTVHGVEPLRYEPMGLSNGAWNLGGFAAGASAPYDNRPTLAPSLDASRGARQLQYSSAAPNPVAHGHAAHVQGLNGMIAPSQSGMPVMFAPTFSNVPHVPSVAPFFQHVMPPTAVGGVPQVIPAGYNIRSGLTHPNAVISHVPVPPNGMTNTANIPSNSHRNANNGSMQWNNPLG